MAQEVEAILAEKQQQSRGSRDKGAATTTAMTSTQQGCASSIGGAGPTGKPLPAAKASMRASVAVDKMLSQMASPQVCLI